MSSIVLTWSRRGLAWVSSAIRQLAASAWEMFANRLSRPVLFVAIGALAGAIVLLVVSSLLGAAVETWSRGDV